MNRRKLRRTIEQNLESTTIKDQEAVSKEEITEKLRELGFNVRTDAQVDKLLRGLVKNHVLRRVQPEDDDGEILYESMV